MGAVRRKGFWTVGDAGFYGLPLCNCCVREEKGGTILTTLMRGVTPLCIRIKPVARTGGQDLRKRKTLGSLREGREKLC